MKTRRDPRHQARRLAMLVLFEWAFHPDSTVDSHSKVLINNCGKLILKPRKAKSLVYDEGLLGDILEGIAKYKDEIDTIIAKSAPEWPIHQISKVDLSVLRIAIFELLHREETPVKVAIDEAVELAKEFGGVNSSRFVNGVLGTVVKEYLNNVESA